MGKVAIIYWSQTGNTEAMANAIADGVRGAGAEADVFATSDFDAAKAAEYSKFAFGCPAMGDEVLEESEFEPLFSDIESSLSGKTVALFGSYGWGDGQWMRDWQDRVSGSGAKLLEDGLIVNGTPEADGISDCEALGKRLAASN